VQAQKSGVNVIYLDAEGVFDITYGKKLGLHLDPESLPDGYGEFTLIQPDTGEELEQVIDMVKEKLDKAVKDKKGKPLEEKDTVGLIIIDSIAASRPEEELKGNKRIGQHASLWARISYKMKSLAKQHRVGIGCINQVRFAPSIGGGFQPAGVLDSSQNNDGSENTTGGEALKFVYSLRWQFKGFAKITREIKNPLSGEMEEQRVGNLSSVVCIKNKLAPPLVKTKFAIEYGKGTVDYHVTEELLKKRGLISSRGTYIKYEPIDKSLIPNADHESYPGYVYGRKRFNEWFRSAEVQADANRRLTALFNDEEIETVDTGDGELDTDQVANDSLSFDIEDMQDPDNDVKIKADEEAGKSDKKGKKKSAETTDEI
jgi:RecA/RadA recombinase